MALPANSTTLDRVTYYALWVFCSFVFLYLTAPILVVLPLSFNAEAYFTYPMPGFSTRWYEDYLTAPEWRLATKNSFLIAIATMCLATPLGTLAALGLDRANFRFKAVIVGVLISPLIVPIVITAVGVYFFYSMLGLTGTLVGLIIVHTALATPFVASRHSGAVK